MRHARATARSRDRHRLAGDQDPRLRTIPVVVVTTSDEDEDIARSHELQANAYVTKPIGLDQLGRVVRAIEDFWFEVVRLPPG